MTSLTKNPYPPRKKIFFKCNLLDYACFDTFAESLERTGAEIFMHKATWFRCFFLLKIPKTSRTSKC